MQFPEGQGQFGRVKQRELWWETAVLLQMKKQLPPTGVVQHEMQLVAGLKRIVQLHNEGVFDAGRGKTGVRGGESSALSTSTCEACHLPGQHVAFGFGVFHLPFLMDVPFFQHFHGVTGA